MFFMASLSGKNISFFSLDSGKILSVLRCRLEICLSKVCTNPAWARTPENNIAILYFQNCLFFTKFVAELQIYSLYYLLDNTSLFMHTSFSTLSKMLVFNKISVFTSIYTFWASLLSSNPLKRASIPSLVIDTAQSHPLKSWKIGN